MVHWQIEYFYKCHGVQTPSKHSTGLVLVSCTVFFFFFLLCVCVCVVLCCTALVLS